MTPRSPWAVTALGLTAAAGLVAAYLAATRPGPPPGPPRLAVLVVFDQLRGDYPERWKDQFGPGGFHRLRAEGAWFPECHYPYAVTATSPGHAGLASGASPARTGVVSNNWYDRGEGAEVYAAGSTRYARVPPPPALAAAKKPKPAGSPDRMLAPTLADAVKAAGGRVVALAGKDRAAVMPAGKRPDACYWFDTDDGQFVTSTYYRDAPHPWVKAFHAARPADAWAGKAWDRLRPELDYARLAGPDDQPGEGKGAGGQGRTFPHPFPAAGKAYYDAVLTSPAANALLLDLVRAAVRAEKLGRGDAPDLLSVSFSANDLVGHTWGPDSQEVLDITLRSDAVLAELLELLDAEVGRGRYVLALSADHGVCPLPEVSRARGLDAHRRPTPAAAGAEAFLAGLFGGTTGDARFLEAVTFPYVYVNKAAVEAKGLKPAGVHKALAGWFARQPGVAAAFAREDVESGAWAGDAVFDRVARSHHPARSGDVTVVGRAYDLFSTYPDGTNHGTPHPYDTHVPLAVFGPGVAAGVHPGPVTPLAAPVVLARLLGLDPPAAAEVGVPEGLLAGEGR